MSAQEDHYVPIKLYECLEAIKKMHPNTGTIEDSSYNKNESLEKLIQYILSLSAEERKIEAFSLTSREVSALCRYLPGNYLHVDNLSAICEVLQNRITKKNASLLFDSWQYNFKNKTCNYFLSLLARKNAEMKELLQSNGIAEEDFAKTVMCDNPGKNIAKACIMDQAPISAMEKIKKRGYNPDALLGKETLKQFFLICRADDYLRAGEDMLIRLLPVLSDEEYDAFLRNFVRFLSDDELEQLKLLTAAVWKRTELVKRRKNRIEILDEENPLNRKFQSWMNGFQMEEMFLHAINGNRRLAFWHKYKKTAMRVIHEEQRTLLKMEFMRIIIIEFSDAGPMYFFDKDYYKQMIEPGMPWTNRNRAVADYLWSYYSSSCIERIEHRGYWEGKTKRALAAHDVIGG